MRSGEKVTHEYFSKDEWMTIEGNKIVTEEGYKHNMGEFWSYRAGKEWDNGYSLFQILKY